ncbi:MAG TPA: histidine kinase [Pseudonocardiaceae bacterium]|nr:histidine kinase [Pseudonocardiaceae bacterium]
MISFLCSLFGVLPLQSARRRIALPKLLTHNIEFGRRRRFPANSAMWTTGPGPDEQRATSSAGRDTSQRHTEEPVGLAALSNGSGSDSECRYLECEHHTTLRRLRRDLHDQVGSSLVGIAMQLEAAERLTRAGPAETHRLISDARSEASALVAQIRGFVSHREWPSSANEFAAAVGALVDRMRRMVAGRMEIALRIDGEVDQVDHVVGSDVFLIVREAMINVLKHSGARHCSVSLGRLDDRLYVRVEDDGVGAPVPHGSDACRGAGLSNMLERARQHGGWCTTSPAGLGGFVVLVDVPLARARASRRKLEHRSDAGPGELR